MKEIIDFLEKAKEPKPVFGSEKDVILGNAYNEGRANMATTLLAGEMTDPAKYVLDFNVYYHQTMKELRSEVAVLDENQTINKVDEDEKRGKLTASIDLLNEFRVFINGLSSSLAITTNSGIVTDMLKKHTAAED